MPVPLQQQREALAASAWTDGQVTVISTLIVAELPGSGGLAGPTWHVSVALVGQARRPARSELRRVRLAFDVVEGEEDNHHPGMARHLFLPVDPRYRGVCECKADETTVVEPDGYRWSNSVEACRGCALTRTTGRPCSLHPEAVPA